MDTVFPQCEEQKTLDPFPLRLGSIEDFIRARSLFTSAGFDDESVCRALEIQKISEIGSAKVPERNATDAESQGLLLLIRIFLFLESASTEEVERSIDRPGLDALLALD